MVTSIYNLLRSTKNAYLIDVNLINEIYNCFFPVFKTWVVLFHGAQNWNEWVIPKCYFELSSHARTTDHARCAWNGLGFKKRENEEKRKKKFFASSVWSILPLVNWRNGTGRAGRQRTKGLVVVAKACLPATQLRFPCTSCDDGATNSIERTRKGDILKQKGKPETFSPNGDALLHGGAESINRKQPESS